MVILRSVLFIYFFIAIAHRVSLSTSVRAAPIREGVSRRIMNERITKKVNESRERSIIRFPPRGGRGRGEGRGREGDPRKRHGSGPLSASTRNSQPRGTDARGIVEGVSHNGNAGKEACEFDARVKAGKPPAIRAIVAAAAARQSISIGASSVRLRIPEPITVYRARIGIHGDSSRPRRIRRAA